MTHSPLLPTCVSCGRDIFPFNSFRAAIVIPGNPHILPSDRICSACLHSRTPRMTTTMPDLSAPPCTMVALRPIPCPDRTIGLSFYEIVSDQSELLANPDLPVFADPESARRSLTRGTLPPPGTTRVLSLSEIPPTARRRLPSSLKVTRSELNYHRQLSSFTYPLNNRYCPIAKDILVVCDLPLVIAAGASEPSLPDTLARFKCLPVLSTETHRILLATGRYSSPKKSIFWGLPCLTPRRFTRSGAPVVSPQAAILRRRDSWLAARAYFDPSPLLSLCSTLESLLTIKTYPGNISDPTDHQTRNYYRLVYSPPICPRPRYFRPRQSEPTWRETLQAHLEGLSSITCFLQYIRTLSPSSSSPAGVLRSPLIFLRRRHYPLLFLCLLEVAPLIPLLLRPFPPSDHRFGTGDTRSAERTCRDLASALYTFMRSITPVVPGRPFLNPFSESLHVRAHPPVPVDPHDQPERDLDAPDPGEPARPE